MHTMDSSRPCEIKKWMIHKASKIDYGKPSAYVLRLFKFYAILCFWCHQSLKREDRMGHVPMITSFSFDDYDEKHIVR